MHSIEKNWDDFIGVGKKDIPQKTYDNMKIAFYAGVTLILSLQHNLNDEDDWDEVLKGWVGEIDAFRKTLKNSGIDTKMVLNPARKQNCPSCDNKINSASSEDSNECPKPGDFSFCLNCRTILVFGDAMDLRLATPEEKEMIREDLDEALARLDSRKFSILESSEGESILCHKCGHSSSNKNDISEKYCSHCKEWLEQ